LHRAGLLVAVTITPETGCPLEFERILNSSPPGCPEMLHVDDREVCVLTVEEVLVTGTTVVITVVPRYTAVGLRFVVEETAEYVEVRRDVVWPE